MYVETIKKLAEINGKKPRDEDVKRMHDIAAATNAADNDTFLAVLSVNDFYYQLYSEMPEKIKSVVHSSAEEATAIAEKQIATISAETTKKLSDVVARKAMEAADAASIKKAAQWATVAVVIIALAFGAVLIYDHKKMTEQIRSEREQASMEQQRAYEDGFEAGKNRQRNEEFVLKQRDEFTKTKKFADVLELDKDGTLESLLYCKNRGWKMQRDARGGYWCSVEAFVDKDGKEYRMGWRLP